MKLNLHCRNVQRRLAESCLITAGLHDLEQQIHIDSATVTLERITRPHTRFRAKMLAVVPGPDLSAEAIDYTLDAAILKAIRSMQQQVHARTLKREKNHRERALTSETVRQRPAPASSRKPNDHRPLKSQSRDRLPYVFQSPS